MGRFAVGVAASVLVTVVGVTEQPCSMITATAAIASNKVLMSALILATHLTQLLQHLI